jgi:hypothetical protein
MQNGKGAWVLHNLVARREGADFPMIGKLFSNGWKTSADFSNDWKKSFQWLEKRGRFFQ